MALTCKLGLLALIAGAWAAQKPNIIHMVVDDWGHADVGYVNPQMKTPYINSLAEDGIKLSSFYVYRFCSPSRSSFQTGRYPWHVGQQTTQNLNPMPGVACGINLSYSFMPKILKKAGYNTMATGKYHLGFQSPEYTPTYRGFDEYLGYYSGAEEHFTHEKAGEGHTFFDLSNNTGDVIRTAPAYVGPNGTYSAFLYSNYTVDFLKRQTNETPFYIYLAWNNVHAPCEAPQQYVDLNQDIQNKDRREFGGMMSALDVTFETIVTTLKQQGLYESTIIVVTTDNGGNLGGSGSNYPLRGGKYTFWEGGVRGNAFVHSPLLPWKGGAWNGIAHAVDLYATFAGLAGVPVADSGPVPVDGVNFWPALTQNTTSPRDSVVLQICSVTPEGKPTNFTGVVVEGKYKLIDGYPGWGKPEWDGWVPTPQVSNPLYTKEAEGHMPFDNSAYPGPYPCADKPCLYDVEADPTEHTDISTQFPDVVARLQALIDAERKTEVSIQEAGLCLTQYGTGNDPRCEVKAAELGFWEPWLENAASLPFTRLDDLAAAVRAEANLGAEIKPFNLTVRDGTKLWTIFADLHKDGVKVPTVVCRSPYGPDGTENLIDLFLVTMLHSPFGFNVVEQNQRGTGQSEGNFTFWSTCPSDEADTIDWILQQPWSNGEVYVLGASADGINAVLAMRETQKELGQWLIFTLGYSYSSAFQGGALKQHLVQHWLQGMQDYRPTAPSYYETVILPHEGHSQWWDDRSLTNDSTITFPSIFWGGWYDIFLQPMIETFQAYDYKSDDLHEARMIIGPRGHCLTAHPFLFPDDRYAEVWSYETALSIYTNNSLPPVHQALLRNAFARYLNIEPSAVHSAKDLDRVTFYVMGPSRGEAPRLDTSEQASKAVEDVNVTGLYWTTLPDFPKSTARQLFLHNNGALQEGKPEGSSTTYTYDPSKPVPTLGGNNLFLACGPVDQTDAEGRSDVLLFTSGPFVEDTAIVGRISVTLYVSSDQVDTDFTVKITDVYPVLRGGASVLIGDTVQRMRWRNGVDSNVTMMKNGEVYEITLELWPTAYIFNEGHRLRLAVSSSNYPRFSANPNNGQPLVNKTAPMIIANNTLYTGGEQASLVELPVVELSAIPSNCPLP